MGESGQPFIDPILGPVKRTESHLPPPPDEDEAEPPDLLPVWIGGGFGRFQLVCYLLTGLMIAVHCCQMMCMKFIAYPVRHWCARPPLNAELQALSDDEWRNFSIPTDSKCEMYDVNYAAYPNLEQPDNLTSTMPCQFGWEFDESHFEDTMLKRWDLVCDRAFMPKISQTVFFMGNMFGVFICGPMADKFGRKRTMMWSLLALLVSAVVACLSEYFALWTVARFFVGASTLSMNTCISVYVVENASYRRRALVHAFTGGLFWSLGNLLLALLIYLVPNMRTLEWALAGMVAAFLPVHFFLPESPRWLLAKGKHERAKAVIRFISKMNGRYGTKFTEDDVYNYHVKGDDSKDQHQKKGTIKDLVRWPGLRRNFLCICFCWLSFSMGYFGVMYNMPTTQSNVYIAYMIPSIFHLLTIPIFPFLQTRFGRKPMITLPLLFGGIVMLCTLLVPENKKIVMTALCILGVLGCGSAFDTGYLITKELFPTVVRTTALASASASARVGSILSPLIAGLDKFSQELPLVVYGVVVLIAGILSVIIWPETNKIKLPDAIEEAEEVAQTRNAWLRCFRSSNEEEEDGDKEKDNYVVKQ